MFHPENDTQGNTKWFVEDRFGMFIHWGLYALPARHEWIKNKEEITTEDYQKYFDHFEPDLYDPKAWAKAAKAAGMKYFVITTKHHEGFCLWDSAYTDYKAPNTPIGKDLLTPMVNAFREEGLKVGFYHSLLDWHHEDFPIDSLHPLRNDPEAEEKNKTKKIEKYTEYLHGQVRELLTNFGKIDILWFDFSYKKNFPDLGKFPGKGKEEWQSEKLIKMIRELQPEIILNDRLEMGGDLQTPEQYQPQEWVKVDGEPVVWETCQTFSGSWGYYRDETSWKSPEQLIQMLVNSVACGGNLLMNVGPTARGEFDYRALEALKVYGEWLKRHGRAIYGCTQSEFTPPADCRYTQKGKRLYLHIFNWPFRHIHLDDMVGKIEYAQLLNDASEVQFTEAKESEEAASYIGVRQKAGSVVLELPVIKPPVTVPVVEIFLK